VSRRARPKKHAAAKTKTASDHPAHILIIDDDEHVRAAHGQMLERAGHDVRAVGSVQSGIETARDWQPDMILLDLVMPDVRGMEALKRVKADPATRDAIVVAFSGVLVEGDAERFRELGFDAILPKPLDVANLVSRIGELLRTKRKTEA
jgi:two-component system cell cycle response regulator DivK